jgi:PAS domain S-box-containing protein
MPTFAHTIERKPLLTSGINGILLFLGLAFALVLCVPPSAWARNGNDIAAALFPVASTGSSEENILSMILGFFLGAMSAAALYLFFIWIVIRERGQVFLMLFLVCLGVNIASGNEIVMNAIGPRSEEMRHLLQSYSLILAYIFSIFFTCHFLALDVWAPHFLKPFMGLAFLLLMLLICSAFDQRLIFFTLPLLGVLTISTVLIAGAATLRHGVSGSLTHIIAFFFFLLGALAGPMHDLGYIATTDDANQLTYTAYALAAMMFAIVIAGQFAARQEEKEHELQVSNERFALAAKGSNEGLFDWNLRTDDVYFSDQFKKLIGFNLPNESASLRIWWRTIYKPDRRSVRNAWRKFRHNPQATAITAEYRILHLDDKLHWIHTKAVATRDSKTGRLLRFVGSVGDVTARKVSEAALRASEMRFRSITEAHPVPVLIANIEQGNILYASPGAELLLGIPSVTILSNTLDRFLTKADERKEISDILLSGQGVNLKEVTLTRGDGNPLAAALSARRINYQNENAMVIGLYDMTKRKEDEVKIAKQQEALQQSEKMAALGGLLAGVAHELNNPLSVIIGQATLLIESAPDPKITSRGEKIFKAADRCSRIVKSFLALARRKPPERKPVDLNAVIHASLELLGYQFRNENVILTLNLDPNLPQINGDSDQLTQVFTNLELNAAQALQDWSGHRAVTITTQKSGLSDITVTIADTGPGIPAEIKTRIFEPFFTTKSGKGGTGVGLSLCMNIVESHGGHIAIETTDGGGATFVITMPTIAQTDVSLDEEEEKTSATAAIGNKRILIVDDELELAQTLVDLLEPDGHEIDMAENGKIALEKMTQKPYDAIISDLRMPVMDGPTMFEEMLKSLPEMAKKTIFVTGDTLSTHIQTFLSHHIVPLIDKPYRLKDVRQALDMVLKGNDDQGNIAPVDSPPQASQDQP